MAEKNIKKIPMVFVLINDGIGGRTTRAWVSCHKNESINRLYSGVFVKGGSEHRGREITGFDDLYTLFEPISQTKCQSSEQLKRHYTVIIDKNSRTWPLLALARTRLKYTQVPKTVFENPNYILLKIVYDVIYAVIKLEVVWQHNVSTWGGGYVLHVRSLTNFSNECCKLFFRTLRLSVDQCLPPRPNRIRKPFCRRLRRGWRVTLEHGKKSIRPYVGGDTTTSCPRDSICFIIIILFFTRGEHSVFPYTATNRAREFHSVSLGEPIGLTVPRWYS